MGWMVALSLALHLLLILVFAGVLLPHMPRVSRPVYYVDLFNLPVKTPRAGRPQAAPRKTHPHHPEKTVSPPSHPAVAHHRPRPSSKVLLPVKPKPKPVAKHHPKPKSKPVVKPKPKPANIDRNYQRTQERIKEMQEEWQRKKKIAELKRKLAAEFSKSEPPPAQAASVPAGSPTGHGDQKGIAYDAWIHGYLKKVWALSRYQVSNNLGLSATVELDFNADGALADWRFLKRSGDARFDQSVKQAVLQLTQLPTPPGSRLSLPIEFNLKDLTD